MDKKKSIINIQDLGLSAANQHSVGGQPILRVFLENFLFLEKNSEFRRATNTLNESSESFKKSINKRFVHN
jgi:hypothetical protein